VVALQELGPGRADGRRGTLKGRLRQTTSLTRTLSRLGGGRYKLVRSTAYFKPGTKHGTQGARILYDSSRYTLLTRCRERTGSRNYNTSCAFDLPVSRGESLQHRRSAAYAQFRDRRTGRRFFVVSAHLDHRHSRNRATEARYNRLRARQAVAIVNKMARLNPRRRPVVFGGDINSWQWDRGRYAPHRALVARGYRDAVRARHRVNVAYSTVNQWRTRMTRATYGSGPKLDLVMVKGARSFRRYENKMARVDRSRPSDHNMVVADVVL
jgi:endonuclease/exonuclease/phosphatase family metal-dependent hydrolase